MKKNVLRILLSLASCIFFTVGMPIIATTAQNNLYSIGCGVMFVFFALCLYLLLTSDFFKTNEELAQLEAERLNLK